MIISGAFHYFRVHPDQWRDRLERLAVMGLDTIETYVPWNLHEPELGRYDFDGIADLGRFLDTVAELGLDAIVRPGPYICAEWENGGLPSWLTGIPGITVRTQDQQYVDAVDRWFDELIPLIAARQRTRGGPVTMVQVENEYGSYGSDREHLRHLRDGLMARGIDVPLFTSDGADDHWLTGGTVIGALATVNFGSRPEEAFTTLRRHRPDDDPFCMEFWNGWFDHWGEPHHTRDAADAADVLDRMLSAGASVNFYMAHGGTNFGCWAGANHDDGYQPTVTSYDYDAPLDEAGRVTPKFWAYREVIARHRELPQVEQVRDAVAASPTLPTGEVELTESVPLRDVFDRIATVHVTSPHPPTFEELGLQHGLVRYRATIPGPRRALPLTLPGLADRAHVFLDGRLAAVVHRDDEPTLDVEVPADGLRLEVLVESMGRVNYGPLIGERKGLVGGVRHERQFVHGWTVAGLALPALPDLAFDGPAADPAAAAAWHRGTLEVEEPADAFLGLDGFTKGYVWVNGFCLGRYWDRGPQRTLFLPGTVLRSGANEVVVLELDGTTSSRVQVRDEADLG